MVTKKLTSFWIVNQITMIRCRYNKSTIPKRPPCIEIKYQRWRKGKNGILKRRQLKITPVRSLLLRRPKNIPAHGAHTVQMANAAQWNRVIAIKISVTIMLVEATKISIRKSFVIRRKHFSTGFKKKMLLALSMIDLCLFQTDLQLISDQIFFFAFHD